MTFHLYRARVSRGARAGELDIEPTRRQRARAPSFTRVRSARLRARAIAGLLPVLLACEPEPPRVGALPERSTFIALARDFAEFREFGQLSLGEKLGQGETHKGGKFVAFVNSLPEPGAKEFPVGTVIVKENVSEEVPTGQSKKIFAMVKRGGGFNAEGARGWEWFELAEGERGVAIHWRGVGAPNGESYGGDPMGSCNGCHQMAIKNDYVLSAALQLK